MLAQRLQILLGHSTFLQAFQHSGASPRWPISERLPGYGTVSLAHMQPWLTCEDCYWVHTVEMLRRAMGAAQRSLLQAARSGGRARARRRPRAERGGVPGGHERAAARAQLPDRAARVRLERGILQLRVPAAV